MRDYNREAGPMAEDFAYPPSGGRLKLIALGFVIPLCLLITGLNIWVEQEMEWRGRGGSITVYGNAARAFGCAWASAALFAHIRWFWGLRGYWAIFETGTKIALLLFIASFLAGVAFSMAYYG